MSDSTVKFRNAQISIDADFSLSELQKAKLHGLLERNFIRSDAFLIGGTTAKLKLINDHGYLLTYVDHPCLVSVFADKPIYLCKMENEINGIILNNCELVLDSGNTAADLVLSLRHARKFDLCESKYSTDSYTFTNPVVLTKMLPPLLVKFSLKSQSGIIVEKTASLDVFVKQSELTEERLLLDPVRKKLSPETPLGKRKERNDNESDREENQKVKKDIDHTSATDTPVNDPSPVLHSTGDSANLGDSGAAKLNIKYDSFKKEIFFIEKNTLPEI